MAIDRQDFDRNFLELEDNFHRKCSDRQKEFFYKQCRFWILKELEFVCQAILDNESSFPTKKVFMIYVTRYRSINEPKNSLKFTECSWCDGYGWSYVSDLAYRGNCNHGEILSDKIPLAPNWATKYPVKEKEDPFYLGKGFRLLESWGIHLPEFMKSKIGIEMEIPF